jgi:hypothetical protein
MKQVEKLDLILRDLYNHKHDGKYYSIGEIVQRLKISDVNDIELKSLAHRLKNDGHIKAMFTHYDVSAALTSEGIDYCEGSSYSYGGNSIITNTFHMEISNSPNANIVSQSSDVNIQITTNEVSDTIKKIIDAVQNNKSVDEQTKQEILECVDEVKTVVDAGKKPKSALASLVHMAGSLAEVGLFVMELARLLGM